VDPLTIGEVSSTDNGTVASDGPLDLTFTCRAAPTPPGSTARS
jgi:hypothetical protein